MLPLCYNTRAEEGDDKLLTNLWDDDDHLSERDVVINVNAGSDRGREYWKLPTIEICQKQITEAKEQLEGRKLLNSSVLFWS